MRNCVLNDHHLVKTAESVPVSKLAFSAGFFFSFRMVIVLICSQFLGMEPRIGTEISIGLNLILFVVICFASFGANHGRSRLASYRTSWPWVYSFLLLSFCSLAWGTTMSLPTSLAYWAGMAADVGMMIVLLNTGLATEVAYSVMKGFLWSTCCLALLAWIMPTQPDLRLGNENFFNANQIGNLCAFGLLFAQYLMRHKEGKWGPAAIFLALTLLRSLSKTTIVALLLSEGLLFIRDRSIKRKTKVLVLSSLLVGTLVFLPLFAAYYTVYTNAGNQAETLTGRTGIWFYVADASLDRPWFGHGFDGMWKVVPPFGPDQFEARHAENELLQQFYAYGIVGIGMLVGIYGSLYWQIRKISQGPERLLFVTILLFVLIRGLAEAEPFDLLLPLWVVVLLEALVKSRTQESLATDTLSMAPIQKHVALKAI